MSSGPLERLLAGTMPDPDGGGSLSVPVRSVVIGQHLVGSAADLVASLELGPRLAVVMDPETRAAMGAAVATRLGERFAVTEIVLPSQPHADMATVQSVEARAGAADGLVAVGAGTVNDLVKFSAYRLGKPYAVFGTAPSMNGYTSVSASIADRGLKTSRPARAALGVFLDLDVMAEAPPRLIAAGFGDSMARVTAQTDWLMAHRVLGTPYRKAPFALLAEDEAALIAGAGRLARRDLGAVERLARTLVLSGLGMTICGSSAPASQGEHLIAHTIEMRGADAPPAYHGELVAVTTLTMLRLQERMIGRHRLVLEPRPETPAGFVAAFGEALGMACWRAFSPKVMDRERLAAVNATLRSQWLEIRGALAAVSRPSAEIERALRAARAPTTPAEIGVADGSYRDAVVNARRIRDRFTMLDLADAVGELEADVIAPAASP